MLIGKIYVTYQNDLNRYRKPSSMKVLNVNNTPQTWHLKPK